MADLYEEILKLKADGRSSAVATIIGTEGSTPRETGAKMLVREDGTIVGTIGGGCLEGQVIVEAIMVIREEKPRIFHYDLTGKETAGAGMICGGVLDIYIEPIIPTPTVFIFGGGHISLFVSKISAMAGFQVAVIDDRAEFARTERFPEAQQVIAEKFSQVFPQLKVNRSSYLVIVTRGHAGDQEVLEWALTTEARYIGMIGSGKKIRTVYQNLEKKGIAPERLQRVHAPIGLEIGALTPEEIAVSIVGQMIREFQQADPKRGIVRPVYRGLRGHPVLIGAQYLQEALQLQGDVGARQILMNHPEDILEIDVDKDVVLKDIDTPEEYQKYTK